MRNTRTSDAVKAHWASLSEEQRRHLRLQQKLGRLRSPYRNPDIPNTYRSRPGGST